ncbi:MAG: ABC transporter permease [Candidatus Pacebacteria bacterium]|nr:ABC transporter permease [Candidatus Paceibacterota bacterium]
MKTRFLISESIQALRSNLLRSLLTIIGIVVGIFSVTAMLALGEGLSANVLDRFSSFASGDITVSGDITYADFTWITEQSYVKDALASLSINDANVVFSGSDFTPTIQTVIGDYEALQSYEVVEGEVYDWNDPTFSESVAVVSDGFADNVLEETGRNVLEQEITINGQSFTVIGVIESSSMLFTRGNGIILLPYERTVGNLTSKRSFASVAALLEDSSYFDIAGQHILKGLNTSRQMAADSEDTFSVETSQAFIETAEETTRMITLFLGIVGSIALFVGGIGTMNMMLTTVTERTKEIGLRKAVGARDRDIMLQILVESVLLTSFGGLVGILLSIGAGKLANSLLANNQMISVLVNSQVIMLAAVVALVVGVVFGLYPARNASKLQPVDALRSE